MMIRKAQGQTVENVLIYLEKPVFQRGQLYVALSQGKVKENVKVFLKDGRSTKNVVIKRVLRWTMTPEVNAQIFVKLKFDH